MSHPVITCIIPVYNVEKYLPKCIDSILVQTFTDFELILVDDGSPDNCGKICDEYAAKDSRVKVIHQENKGVSAARNAGLDVARGEYICFVDSDDWVDADYMKAMYDAAVETGADMVVCGYRSEVLSNSFDLNSKLIIKKFPSVFTENERIFYTRKEFLKVFPKLRTNPNMFAALQSPWMRLIKRIQGRSLPGFFDEKLKKGEDYLFNIHIYENLNSICYIKPQLYNYCYVHGSASKQISLEMIQDEMASINETELFFKNYCLKKDMKYFYRYKKYLLYLLVTSALISREQGGATDISEQIKLIRGEISLKVFFADFFKIKESIILFMTSISMTGGGVLTKLYIRARMR